MNGYDIDIELLNRFESELIPHDLSGSSIPAKMIGYGEISAIFQIGDQEDIVFKRIPIFPDRHTAVSYRQMYVKYCSVLEQAGINLPEDDAAIVEIPGHPVVIYFAQKRFPDKWFCHNLIHTLDAPDREKMVEQILSALKGIWRFNNQRQPEVEIAIDCQLSNWVWSKENGKRTLYLVDTSTPFLRENRAEQLDVELLLQSVPVYIRWLIRLIALDEVIARYYDHKKVVIDLVANLYKEQRPDLIPWFLDRVNPCLKEEITKKQIDAYYREDKMIWTLFSAIRKIDRFIRVNLLGKRYEFILPGTVKR